MSDTPDADPHDLDDLITKNKSQNTGQFLKTGRLAMRVTPAMALRILRQCVRHGSGLSGYVRRAIIRQLEEDEGTDPARAK